MLLLLCCARVWEKSMRKTNDCELEGAKKREINKKRILKFRPSWISFQELRVHEKRMKKSKIFPHKFRVWFHWWIRFIVASSSTLWGLNCVSLSTAFPTLQLLLLCWAIELLRWHEKFKIIWHFLWWNSKIPIAHMYIRIYATRFILDAKFSTKRKKTWYTIPMSEFGTDNVCAASSCVSWKANYSP